jgi:hypothetical protein
MQLNHLDNVYNPALENHPNGSLHWLGLDCSGVALAPRGVSFRERADGWHELGCRLSLWENDFVCS